MAVKLECSICLTSLFGPAALFQDEATRADGAGRSNGVSTSSFTGSNVGVGNHAMSVIVKTEKKSPKKPTLNPNEGSKGQSDLLSGTSGTPCGHLFHTHCLQNWFKQGKGCPTCRKKFPKSKIIPMFVDACVPEAPTLRPMPMPIRTPRSTTSSSQSGSDFNFSTRQPTATATPVKRKVVVISSKENHDVFPTGTVAIKVEKDIPEANSSTVPKNDTAELRKWKDTHEKLTIEHNVLKRRLREIEDEKEICLGMIASLEHNQAEQPQAKLLKYEEEDNDEDDEFEIIQIQLTPNSAQRNKRQADNDASSPDGKRQKY